jgi:hypothetical protein
MAADSKRDRTSFFQALERELEIGDVASCETGTALTQAETALAPFFENQDRLKRALSKRAKISAEYGRVNITF